MELGMTTTQLSDAYAAALAVIDQLRRERDAAMLEAATMREQRDRVVVMAVAGEGGRDE
jgi:hypothetical protein